MSFSLSTRSGLRFDQILASWLIAGALLCVGALPALPPDLPQQLVPQVAVADIPFKTPVSSLEQLAVAPANQLLASQSAQAAQSFLVVDKDSGAVLAEKAARTPQYPASTIKLLTALVVLEQWSPTETLTLRPVDFQVTKDVENPLAWQIGEVVSIRDLLASLLINSDNATAMILARHYPGGETAFITAMEKTAERLSLSQTHFVNPVGLDAPDQKLSAWDLAILAREVLKDPVLTELVQQKIYTVTDWHQGLAIKHFLTNTNELLWSAWQVKGIKTGTTELAGEVLVSLVTVKDHDVIVVVMGSQDRYVDTQRLLREVQEEFTWQSWAEMKESLK